MKRIFRTLAVIFSLFAIVGGAYAKAPELSDKEKAKIQKENLKEAKKMAKQLQKEGWRIQQTGAMESVIARHMDKLAISGVTERVGETSNRSSISICQSAIRNNVSRLYAQEQTEVIKGVITQETSALEGSEAENFVSQMESRLAMDLAGELVESYSLVKQNKDKTYDMKVYYVIDPEKAQATRLRAAKYALERQNVTKEFRDAVHKAVEGK